MASLPSPIILLILCSLLFAALDAQRDDDSSYYRDVRAPKLIRFGRAGPKLVRFGKRSDPEMNAEEYDNTINEMISEYKRGGPKLVRFG